jgi:hypothetical protein
MVDSTVKISKAQTKLIQEQAAPAYLKRRVEAGAALPSLEVVGQPGQEEEEEERKEMLAYVLMMLPEDLYIELVESLRYRRCLPVEEGQH